MNLTLARTPILAAKTCVAILILALTQNVTTSVAADGDDSGSEAAAATVTTDHGKTAPSEIPNIPSASSSPQLPKQTADQFEFYRTQRILTLDDIDQLSAFLATYPTRLQALEEKKAAAEQQKDEFEAIETAENLKRILEERSVQQNQHVAKIAAEQQKTPVDDSVIEEMNYIKDLNEGRIEQIRKTLSNYDIEEKKSKQEEAGIKSRIDSSLREISDFTAEKERTEQEIRAKRENLRDTDDQINRLFIKNDADTSFRFNMSLAFTILVGFVILGFFIMAGIDPIVRQKIFSGESGIQFITLFSLVIAIILFGIIGILEGKELAALLGGLSGYILGRGVIPKSA